jgi:hypothetical protein
VCSAGLKLFAGVFEYVLPIEINLSPNKFIQFCVFKILVSTQNKISKMFLIKNEIL